MLFIDYLDHNLESLVLVLHATSNMLHGCAEEWTVRVESQKGEELLAFQSECLLERGCVLDQEPAVRVAHFSNLLFWHSHELLGCFESKPKLPELLLIVHRF